MSENFHENLQKFRGINVVSVTQNLREINFVECRSSESAKCVEMADFESLDLPILISHKI